MTRAETIERKVASLSGEELAAFRECFAESDAVAWARRIADDARSGKLDGLANEAIRDHRTGKSTEF